MITDLTDLTVPGRATDSRRSSQYKPETCYTGAGRQKSKHHLSGRRLCVYFGFLLLYVQFGSAVTVLIFQFGLIFSVAFDQNQ